VEHRRVEIEGASEISPEHLLYVDPELGKEAFVEAIEPAELLEHLGPAAACLSCYRKRRIAWRHMDEEEIEQNNRSHEECGPQQLLQGGTQKLHVRSHEIARHVVGPAPAPNGCVPLEGLDGKIARE